MARKRRNYTDELKKKIVELYNSENQGLNL